MATSLLPSSFECDCGHQVHFFENTVREMAALSLKKRKPQQIGEGGDDHTVEFRDGRAAAVHCPQRGRCPITGETWDYEVR
jgi:hypothetical protein